jgi:hypothetical protein
MRLSIFPDDPGYSPEATEVVVSVLVNGVPIPNIVTVDEERHLVMYYEEDEDGLVLVDGQLQIGTITGVVRIILKPGICPELITRKH